MKKIYTHLLLFIMASLGNLSFSAAQSSLNLDLFTDGQFVVHMNGIRHSAYQGNVRITGLYPGTHNIRIVEVFRGRAHRGRGRVVLFDGSINIPFRSVVYARLNNHNQLRVTDIQRLQGRRGQRGYNRHGYRQPARGRVVSQFQITRNQMIRAAMDRDKLAIARRYVARNDVTSSQVASLMSLMTFDRNKLALAKYAYPFTIDQHNYHFVNRAFTFDSSIRELNRFINRRPAPNRRPRGR